MDRGPTPSRRTVLAGAGAILASGCLDVQATPTPRDADWRMYGRDPGRTRHVPDARLPRDGVEVAWEQQVSASSWLPPVVANGVAYCQNVNGLFVLDPVTGDGPNVGTYGGFGRGGPLSFGSTEAYDDGVLIASYGNTVGGYAAAPERWPDEVSGLGERRARWWTDGDETDVRPVSAGTAEVAWGATPVVSGGTVIGINAFSNTAWAVDANDGSVRWQYDLGDAVEDVSEPLGLVLDRSTGTVVVAVRNVADPVHVGIDVSDGTPKWTHEYGGDDPRPAERNAAAASDGTCYVVTRTDSGEAVRVRELDAETGDAGWTRSVERHLHNGVAVDDEAVYHLGTVGDSQSMDAFAIAAIDRDDGEVRWEKQLSDAPGFDFGVTVQPPTIAGDCLLIPGGDGLHALDRTNGEHLWTFTELVDTAGGSETERVASTPAVVTGDRIVLGMTTGLYGLE